MNQEISEAGDEELVSLALKNSDYFLPLVWRYQPRLSRYLRRLFKLEKEEVEDILQEVFLKVYVNLNDFDQSLKFSSWIYRISHNQAVSYYRKKLVRPYAVPIDENMIDDFFVKNDVVEEFDRHIAKEKVELAIAKLDFKYREVIVLKFLEEKDYREISDIIKKPMGTVATLINRAKKQLAEELKHFK